MFDSPLKNIIFLLTEHFLIFLSVIVACFLRFYNDIDRFFMYEGIYLKTVMIAVVCQFCLYFNDFYDFKVNHTLKEVVTRLIQSFGVASIVLAAIYYSAPATIIGRGIFILTIFISILLILLWRSLYQWVSNTNVLGENVLIVGTGSTAKTITKEVLNRAFSSFRIVGFLEQDDVKTSENAIESKILGNYDDLEKVVDGKNIDRIIVAMNDRRGHLPLEKLMKCRFKGIQVEEAPSFYEKLTGKIMVDNLKPSWLIFSDGFRRLMFKTRLKRITSLTLSTLGIILAAPIIVLTSIAIKLTSKGDVFLRQERVGLYGKRFILLKFRSMRQDAEVESGPVWATDNDHRITPIGKFIRKTRIDEIPQLFNVFKGDMNFVGPRPEREFFIEQLKKEIPYYTQRLTVKPGLTGWAQIKYQYGNTVDDALEKLQYDLYYIKNGSLFLDFSIIFETVKVVLLGKGAK